MELEGVPFHDVEADDIILAKDLSETLEKHYPGWAWMVNIDSDVSGGVVRIVNGVVNAALAGGKTYGYTYYLKNLRTMREIRTKAIEAGGNILERAGQPRGPYRDNKIVWVEGVALQHQPSFLKAGLSIFPN